MCLQSIQLIKIRLKNLKTPNVVIKKEQAVLMLLVLFYCNEEKSLTIPPNKFIIIHV